MSNTLPELNREIAALSTDDQTCVREYVAYLRWRAQRGREDINPAAPTWRFNLLEHLASADVRASRDAAGMEVKAAEATVGGERRPALWQHPPVQGEGLVEFHVPIPARVQNLRLQFGIGIREGIEADPERLVAYRVRVDGWQVWSRAAWPLTWQPFEVPLPLRSGDMVRLTFATDSLGAHQWAWAVWGEPTLIGVERGT
jgi:hypothetical protein